MSRTRHALSIVIGLILVAGIAVFVFWDKKPNPSPAIPDNSRQTATTTNQQAPQPEINFSETGNVINKNEMRGNSELALVYEKPGAPALTVDLVINEKSLCVFGTDPEREQIVCMALSRTLGGGIRAKIEGVRTGNTVEVITFTSLEEN